MKKATQPYKFKITSPCSGFCTRCRTLHELPMGRTKTAAFELMKQLDQEKRLDFHLPPADANPRFSTDYLFGEARGKMFGVMECQRRDGTILDIKSFSGQYNGTWDIEGWAPPLFDVHQWHKVNDVTEKEIKKMGVMIDTCGKTSPRGAELVERRKNRSRQLMKALHGLYTLHNFRGQCRPLSKVYIGHNGIPNGTGDCCGPKLLNFAARRNLRPLGLTEFYYGRENKRGSKAHGNFYTSCREKCSPILGYMLCGSDTTPNTGNA